MDRPLPRGIGSAVASRSTVQAQGTVPAHFLLVHDLPIIKFGGERSWRRAYYSQFGGNGRNAADIAAFAIAHRDEWQGRIEKWQQQIQQRLAFENQDMSISGALINDLYFLMGGGTAWVSGANGEAVPVLGDGPHFALLEGFDTGYYYYNTFDLWVYAFPAFLSGWPRLAGSVFDDYLRAVDLQDETTRMIYRPAERRRVLKAGKIPHDLGSAMEDPWHDLNGYSWRDDPNVWLDHNPAFIASFYLFCRCSGRKIERGEWEILVRAADHMIGQDHDGDGLPEHGEFGDSTWDALSLSGIGAYSGGLSIAALAVMAALSDEFDTGKATKYRRLLRLATAAFQRELWNGAYFNSCSQGKYKEALQTDALFGPYLAELAGLHVLPTDRIRSHLLAVYRHNYCGYEKGRVGPLLVSNPSGEEYVRDGGEDLQLGEVIVGSAWAYTGMLDFYGLPREAGKVAGALVHTLYYDSGLQFRSPAAWDGRRRFRAPLNMRPLASWFLYLNRISAEQF
ncbi:MAG: GH116 family glycosyl hydrolase [Spirochaetia bacterium]|nr:GH116 family glycosyl hydrolase [Spirochaetia bacterium]